MRRRQVVKPGETVLRPVFPNAGITAVYRRALIRLIDAMNDSVRYWLTAAYRAHPPLAQDDTPGRPPPPTIATRQVPTNRGNMRWSASINGQPIVSPKTGLARTFATEAAARRAAKIEIGTYLPAEELQEAMNDLAVQWQGNFDAAAEDLARYFSKSASRRSDGALQSALKKGGFAIEFAPSKAMLDIMEATVQANVQLIKTIPQHYLAGVQGAVMRSVQQGRDLGSLTAYLTEQHGVTKRRAAFIALDQNNKATSAMQKARQTELGIVEGIWMHSHAGREPRPTHVANDGKRYDIAKGWHDPDPKVNRRIWPGELLRCRCTGRSVMPFKVEGIDADAR